MSDNKQQSANHNRQQRPGHMGPPGFAMPGEKPKEFKKTLKRLLLYLSPHRFSFIIIFAAAILSTIFNVVSPMLLGNVTTSIFSSFSAGTGVDFSYIGNISVFLIVLYILSSFFMFIQQYLMAGVSQNIIYKMRTDVNEKLTRLPLSYFDRHPHGDTLSRAINDIDNINTTLQQTILQVITSVITLVGIIVMMLVISPLLTLIVCLTIPLSIIAVRKVASFSQKHFMNQQKELGEINGHIEEMFTGHQVLKAYGYEDRSIEKYKEINERLYHSGWKSQFISGIMMPLMMFISNIGYICVSIVGAFFVINGRIQIGDVQAFIQYSRQFSQPLMQVANVANLIQSAIASAERIFTLLDENEERKETPANIEMERIKGNVSFQHVQFSYDEQTPLIKDMSVEVKAGQTVAIVGPTGAGKTTLINLLMRFYELNGGDIYIDGHNITDFSREQVRQLFAMVLQDTWLFQGTIRDNIAYGRSGAREEEIVQAAKNAYADDFIRTLPDGYDTVLTEDAGNISQGQRQLLTIARALLADPKILILDEATSSVDTRTEMNIQKAMNQLMVGRTSFVIAHRLSTIRDADLILVMNHGDIIEQGTHKELLSQHGFYAELHNSQFADVS
ncbi:ABC transporter ATP-binding protein [Bacillaceae bacterium Marseille-Q3522]|nr:ABC transporter ATP-binding protein [Bacillaceae bacterium Marseille-Q3522]